MAPLDSPIGSGAFEADPGHPQAPSLTPQYPSPDVAPKRVSPASADPFTATTTAAGPSTPPEGATSAFSTGPATGGETAGVGGAYPPPFASPTRPRQERQPELVLPPPASATPPAAPSQHPDSPRRRTPLLLAGAALFALGGVVGAGGFALGRSTADSGADAASEVVPISQSDTTGSTAPQPAAPSDSAQQAAPTIVQSTDVEPAAAVASVIGPSVVQVETNRGQGSGVVFADGMILTNHHVIDGATEVQIRTTDGRVFETTVVGSDARNDIAVLSAPGSDVPVAAIGSSRELEVGQLAVAIGSPFSLQQTVTAGIVSSVNRPVPNESGGFSAMIQTDAPINPGNSGGALANKNGELIGINSSIRTDGTSNSNLGIGFAVPIDTAINVAERIIAGESLEPGVLGVSGSRVDGDVGVPIETITPGSGADTGGLQVGDRVLTINGAPVTSFGELGGLVQSSFAGDTLELTVQRGNDTLTLDVTLG